MLGHIRNFFAAGQSDNPAHVKNWRLIVTAGLLLFGLFVTLVIAGDRFGLSRHAWAGEVEEQIQAALRPINKKLTEQQAYLERLVKKDIREELYAHFHELCAQESASKRQTIRDEINDLQVEYKNLTGRNYPQPSCEDL